MPACNKKPAGNKVIKKPAAKAVHKTNVKVTPKAKAKDKNSVPKLTREQKAYWPRGRCLSALQSGPRAAASAGTSQVAAPAASSTERSKPHV